MKAVIIDETSPTRSLLYTTIAEPVIGPADLLVAVKAAGVNRADLRRAATHFAASTERRLTTAGLELAGEVLEIGPDVTGIEIGDRVMAMAGAAYAEKAVVDYRLVSKIPPTMSWQAAAATPVAFITAHNALVTAGEFKQGQSVLIQGASSGVGIATIQIARLVGASKIFGTAGSEEKLGRLKSLGCDVAIDYRKDDLSAVVARETGSRGVDVIVDFAGGAMVQRNIEAASVRGRIVCAGRVAGTEATVNIDEFSRKQLHMVGVTNRTRSLEERITVVREFERDVLAALESRAIIPVLDKTYALEEAESAQDYMKTNRHFGKIVLTIASTIDT